jgi:formate hydrogenlyase subunit 4
LAWVVVLMCAVTRVETMFAKLRLFEVPQLLGTAFVLEAASIVLRVLGILA